MQSVAGSDDGGGVERSGAEVLSRFRGRRGTESLDANPQLRAFLECWLDTFLFNGTVDARLRESTILRVMWRCGRSFEWANHYKLARQVGMTDEEVVAIRAPAPKEALPDDVAVVMSAADEMVDLGRLTPATYAAVTELFPDPGTRHEFLYLVAGYRMFASVSATTGNEAEARGLPRWPPDGVAPPRASV